MPIPRQRPPSEPMPEPAGDRHQLWILIVACVACVALGIVLCVALLVLDVASTPRDPGWVVSDPASAPASPR